MRYLEWYRVPISALGCGIPNSFHFSCRWVKPYLTSYIFLIYEADPLSPPEGEAAKGVRPLHPRVKLMWSNNILAQRGLGRGGRATPEGVGLLILLNIFVK
jgi:hypothetical protein